MDNEPNSALDYDQRRNGRMDLQGQLQYRYGSGDVGMAAWRTVSAQGASVVLGRYLRPGRRILLTAEIPWAGTCAEFKGRIVWCRPSGDHHHFESGIAIYNDEPGTARALSMLVAQARFEGKTCTLC